MGNSKTRRKGSAGLAIPQDYDKIVIVYEDMHVVYCSPLFLIWRYFRYCVFNAINKFFPSIYFISLITQ